MLRVIRKADIILFFALIAAAVLSAVLFAYSASGNAGQAVITLDGKPYGTYSLFENQEIQIQSSAGTNVVLIEDGNVRMKYSDCHNQICVEHAPISRSGESIICLPHKLVVEVRGGKEADVDAIAK